MKNRDFSRDSMFSKAESNFIRDLAADYTKAHFQTLEPLATKVPSKCANLSPIVDSFPRKIGTTDYAKFESMVAELDECGDQPSRVKETGHSSHGNEGHMDFCGSCGTSCSHDHSKERNIYEKPFAEKIAAAQLFRDEGNSAFRSRKFDEALTAYKRAIVYLDYTVSEVDAENELADTERCKCYLNMAACTLEDEKLSSSINYCRLALQLDPNNSKAFYRRGLAHLRRGDLEEAQTDLYKAMKLIGNESKETRRPVETAIRELNVKWREYKKKTSDIARAAIP